MAEINHKVDWYFKEAGKWQQEVDQLRTIVLECNLNETLKWGVPCYTLGKNNVVLIHTFKHYCALLFFKGALLSNKDGLLIRQSENVQAARQLRFTNIREIVDQQSSIKACIYEAIAVEHAGLKVALKETREFTVCSEFRQKLAAIPALTTAFEQLTPGRQRAYLLHFSSPKQSKTREARIEKYIPQILKGKGLND